MHTHEPFNNLTSSNRQKDINKMAEENKQKQIEEIQEKISAELRDVERLEEKEQELLEEEREHHDHEHKHLVRVEVDKQFHEVRPGDYRVAEFKEVAGVPAAKELEQIMTG